MSFHNFSNSSFGSPPRGSEPMNKLARSPSSPFSTSPSQLEEIIREQTTSFKRPLGGRSVKEFEEQLTNLKKENFNLKLRIYFLEEKMGTNFTLDKDNIVKKNIEFQVKITDLQQEVAEKHDLLCQAVKAMELQEEEHKKESIHKENQISNLQQEVDELKLHMEVNRCRPDIQGPSSVFDKSDMFKFQMDTLQKECQSKDETIFALNRELSSANERLSDFEQHLKDAEERVEQMHLKNENLQTKSLDQQKTLEKLYSQLENVSQKLAAIKFEFEEERKEYERQKKSLERNQITLTTRLDLLYSENKKYKEVIRDLQGKLEAAINEAKKNQNLAVLKSDNDEKPNLNTDNDFILVPDAATSDGTPKKDALHVSLSKMSSKVLMPTTPNGTSLVDFERLLTEYGVCEQVACDFNTIKSEFNAQKQKIIKLKSEQLKACEIIKSMIDVRFKNDQELAQLKKEKQELEKELENVATKLQKEQKNGLNHLALSETVETAPCENCTLAASQLEEMEIVEQYKLLTVELEAKVEVLVATLKEKDSQMQCIRNQYDEILNTLEEKENRIVDLEFELLSNQNSGKIDKSLLEKGDMGSEKHSSFYKHELEEKNQEIERLNVELKKCTCYLQEIVNKELWDKNKEIEKLHRKQEATSEVMKLKKELSGKDLQLKVLKDKISELGLDIKLPSDIGAELKDFTSPKRNIEHIKILKEQLKSAKEEKEYLEIRVKELEASEEIVKRLKEECDSNKCEIEKSEKLRNETNEVCAILSTRLEELAIFLDSLLKHKSVLGFLGLAKNKRLRELINNSLDMSRSFSMSLMGNPEQSLAQLSNITAFLNNSTFQNLNLAEETNLEEETHFSILPDNISLTYQSHLYKKVDGNDPDNEQVIAALREQVFNLKTELKLRDNELNRLSNKESGVEKLSDTEEEKEVSKLFSPKSTSATLKMQSDAHSESEAWSEPDRVVSKARIGLNHSVPPTSKVSKTHYNESTEDDDLGHNLTHSKKRNTIIELTQEITRLEKELEHTSEEVNVNSRMYRQKLQELDVEIQENKEKLAQVECERNNAQKKVESLQKKIEDLSAFKENYEAHMFGKDKEMQGIINQLEVEKQKLLVQSQEFERQAINSQNELVVVQEKIKILQNDMEQNDGKLRKEYEEKLIGKLKNAEQGFTKQVKEIEEKCDSKIKIMQENVRVISEEYSRDYVKKSEVDKKLAEVEKLLGELTELKATVDSYEETIRSYKDKEREVRGVVQEYQEKNVSLKAQLDKASLQYSEAVLEKTKLGKEKQILEEEMSKISEKERELRDEMINVESKLTEVSQKHDKQITTLQKQKSGLELKISELENANAELHNRLIKTHTSKFSLGLNATLPLITTTHRPLYERQYSDAYNSEDNAEELRNFPSRLQVNPAVQPSIAEVERAEANSSPDLGIESDHGRFSSLETNTHNVPRPLLQTIELTESMNNLFDGQNINIEDNNPANDHCCQKSLEIAQENNELKRKLLRMKRALEETATQLNLANQRKKQVEKTICKQIHKTSQVLRKAKANLDSGSESDVLRM